MNKLSIGSDMAKILKNIKMELEKLRFANQIHSSHQRYKSKHIQYSI